MNDADCITFLRWVLPKLELRWGGFHKVRREVCNRVKRRIHELGLDSYWAYCMRLEADADEWTIFDNCCHITISRFFRDRGPFEVLRRRVLPNIGTRAQRERRDVQVWSAGVPRAKKRTL
jgi:chemotaxis protein methyltransferase CheR